MSLRGARLDLWRCNRSSTLGCPEALDELWRHATDPEEVALAAGLARSLCTKHGGLACDVTRGAYWFGRGVESTSA